ncbi:hypothetical protein [Galbibacter pacificus]|uniref:Arm DNA-binding domain-containing protein n=1 Tax=Galbibacter pacificus TaxID=2996052 RepID=A0ABT6FME2_9FLAO|nr:hypothetical protein [Galbibacter pacificus]MDG3580766.1 hypothetical protein [Galbibacter pacificus]MDG3584244.1 hypothetical protein [Galbibacter pacificus]
MMKEDDKRCILSIKYSILDTSSNKKAKETEIERVFIAKNKNILLRKIKDFEDKLQKKPKPSFLSRKAQYLHHFLKSWRYTYHSMLKI